MIDRPDTKDETEDRPLSGPCDVFRRLHPSLPLFGIPAGSQYAVYTPGQIFAVSEQQFHGLARIWSGGTAGPGREVVSLAERLEKAARDVEARWAGQQMLPFTPECLTVYLSNQCNADCVYCYARSSVPRRIDSVRSGDMEVSVEAVACAARLVADACARCQKPFWIVIHGGGEPTLHWGQLQEIVRHTRELAQERGIDWRSHIATNGLISEAQAAWIADQFTSVSVSHDGPPDIHNVQRPTLDGRPSLAIVERTIQTLQGRSSHFYVRTTLLPGQVGRQQEIVEYLYERLQVTSIHIEPAYPLWDQGAVGFRPSDAEGFIEHFLQARTWAGRHDVAVSFSGLRMQELHGPYCNVLRHTLHLIPGDVAGACPFTPDKNRAMEANTVVGHYDRSSDAFILDADRIEAHRRSAYHLSATCRDCPGAYHCVRGCPARCHIVEEKNDPASLFRCRVSRLLLCHEIRCAATNVR